ncbi:Cys-tRNA(Pro) deacylase [Alteromonas macleodii]|uniref:Cys-tRNA(Pro)/Cys-tRNA(Cys) deacylase n=1 Tax=Alteromonas macleodii TaxID=28108 RepID=A0AB36G2E3_ALTMA|nr:Cys-tRNA(Pro) deacylase [Alteromonas macleodii]OES34176.1 ybaK / prolyl-tRNA synthetases associated domain protein [Alteromonas macleodii]OES35300.1 ybaK / prolyl-tRNA synthetases associated domain protein [Alteromonas macleodii]OES37391.1 ybaK / prolyl-tRNA synthetases associated domain protein [Alteromonas macleodii]OES42730.1 ybaK / prolyl-tRNA synthetases associated domain protein [Alteromonas macleodii]OZC00393.1 aminoacyl-tRNA deacylase [Alteromonas macleodii]
MTPAITLLIKKRIAHSVLKYEHDANAASYGLEAVEKLNLDADTVFKTLVVSTDNNKLAVAVVPVNTKLSEKKMAKALGVKKVEMAQANAVMVATGYVLGGVSPLGQKKRLASVIHKSAENLQTIHVSAGRRGLEVALDPSDLAMLTSANFADISVD